MSDRLTRKEIKQQDAFTHSMGEAVHYVQDHRRLILGAVAGVVALALIVFGVMAWVNHSMQQANAELARGIQLWQAPVQATGAKPDDPVEPSFPTDEARRNAAKKVFTELHDRSGAGDAGDLAGLYLAQISLAEGDRAGARKLWQDFVDAHGDTMPAAGARLSLFALDRADGKAAEVETEVRRLLESPEKELPDDVLLYQLAVTLDAEKKGDEARQTWQRIVDEHPESPYVMEARRHIGQGAPLPGGLSIG